MSLRSVPVLYWRSDIFVNRSLAVPWTPQNSLCSPTLKEIRRKCGVGETPHPLTVRSVRPTKAGSPVLLLKSEQRQPLVSMIFGLWARGLGLHFNTISSLVICGPELVALRNIMPNRQSIR